MNAFPVLGIGVFVVEDEPLLTMMLEELLDELGCSIPATATSLAEAMAALARVEFDVALLDVHLHGQPVWPLADRLQRDGRVFVVASGDDARSVPARFRSAVFLQKPYELESLARALQAAVKHLPKA